MTRSSATDLDLVPLTPNFGAAVNDLVVAGELADAVVTELKEALLRYQVLFFRGRALSSHEHHRFAGYFGTPYDYSGKRFEDPTSPEKTGPPEEGAVEIVANIHSDLMYREVGPAFSVLQMQELPEVGGDTIWADLVSSYEALSEDLRSFLDPLTAVHVAPRYYYDDATLIAVHKRATGEELSAVGLSRIRQTLKPTEHPLVRRIPETGRKNYWLAEACTKAIKELRGPESDAILKMLFAHQVRPEFVIRWRWRPGDVVLFDNRTTLHAGIPDYGDQRRSVRRVSVGPHRPER